MKDITKLKRLLESRIAKKFCDLDDISLCTKEHCECKIAAEVQAYMLSIIPRQYHKLSIDDFTGKKLSEELLSTKVAIEAKRKLVEYCWGVSLEVFNRWNETERLNALILDRQKQKGRNVVVYSDTEKSMMPFEHKDKKEIIPKRGKTMVASLIMKEAIRNRMTPGHYIETYDWIEFSVLLNALRDKDTDMNNVKASDWLVVDDIRGINNSKSMDSFIASMVDPFFFERLQSNLPTILVFRFDINDPMFALEDKFGVAISQIVDDQNTLHISLCEEKE